MKVAIAPCRDRASAYQPTLLLKVGVVAMALAVAGGAQAAPIDAFGLTRATCFDQRQGQIDALDASECFVLLSTSNGTNTSSASAQIVPSTSPAVRATALHAVAGHPAPGNNMVDGYSAFALASVLYDVSITLKANPDAVVSFLVPVLETHHLFGAVRADDGTPARVEAGSVVSITDPRNNVPLLSHSIGAGDVGVDDSYDFVSSQVLWLQPNVDYVVEITARCAIQRDGGSEPEPSTCIANTDPTFQFDQAAFDALMGPNTFPLTERFEFRFSPNLINPPTVPEPATFLVLIVGRGAFLAFRLAQRRSSRRRLTSRYGMTCCQTTV